MLAVNAVGRVTKDLEVKQSKEKVPYIRFNFAVNKGYGGNAHPVYLQCWVFGDSVDRILKAKVGKGSLLHITGDLDITKFKKADGTEETTPKVIVWDWGYIPVVKTKSSTPQPCDQEENTLAPSINDFEHVFDDDDPPF